MFGEVDGVAAQQVRRHAAGIDLTAAQVAEDDQRRCCKEAGCGEPLVRAWLFQVAPDEWVLVVVMHPCGHRRLVNGAVRAGLSVAMRAVPGAGAGLAGALLQYADYTIWQRDLGSPDDPASLASPQVAYWAQALRGAPEELALPTFRTRPAVASHRGDRVAVQATGGWRELARQNRASVFMVLQAAFAAVLGAGTDIPVGTPIAGRTDGRRGPRRPGRDVRQHPGAAHRSER